MVGRRCTSAIGATVMVLVAGGCTPSGGTTDRSAATSVSQAPSSTSPSPPPTPAGCATPPPASAAPTDFPHPELTRNPVSTADSAADDALADQGLAALRAFGGPVATSAFQHYLGATGDYLPLPVDGLLAADPDVVTELNGVLVDAAASAVQRAATGAPCGTVAFTSGWLPHADVDDADWRYALGRFYVQVLGTVTRDDTGLRVTYRAAVGDTYNFDPGTTFARFAQLAEHGRVAVFLDGGLTTARSTTVRSRAAELGSSGFG